MSPVRNDVVFGTWLERRRAQIKEQLSALEEERYGDLVDLITMDEADRPPPPRSERERQEFEQMLADSRELTERLIKVRGKILEELRGIERRRVMPSPRERRSERGRSLDGYL
ncbi:MAG: hypothetical protein AAF389_13185 [Gemmatimonadota bacterium]